MRKLFILLLYLSLFIPSFLGAQVLKERRVYYLDCSYSMLTNMTNGTPIWDIVRQNLCKAIDEVRDPGTELLVIPFAIDGSFPKKLKEFREFATPIGKATLKKEINAIRPKTTSMTYLAVPIEDFYNIPRVDNDRVTYMFLMTDGKDEWEKDPALYSKELRKWNSEHKFGDKYVYGFNVMLCDSARNPVIENLVDSLPHFWNVESADVNINIVRVADKGTVKVMTDSVIELPIWYSSLDFTINASMSDPNYSIQKTQINGDKLQIFLDKQGQSTSWPQKVSIPIELKITSDNPYTFFVTPKVDVVFLKIERTVKISVK